MTEAAWFECHLLLKTQPHAAIHNTFTVQRHLISRRTLRIFRAEVQQRWQNATAAA